MKKIILILMCLAMCTGCTPDYYWESESERQMDLDDLKAEIYNQAYEEGYMDAVETVLDGMPWYLIDAEELKNSISMTFKDEALADEVKDLIFSYCKLYERTDFSIPYSNLDMDYAY